MYKKSTLTIFAMLLSGVMGSTSFVVANDAEDQKKKDQLSHELMMKLKTDAGRHEIIDRIPDAQKQRLLNDWDKSKEKSDHDRARMGED